MTEQTTRTAAGLDVLAELRAIRDVLQSVPTEPGWEVQYAAEAAYVRANAALALLDPDGDRQPHTAIPTSELDHLRANARPPVTPSDVAETRLGSGAIVATRAFHDRSYVTAYVRPGDTRWTDAHVATDPHRGAVQHLAIVTRLLAGREG